MFQRLQILFNKSCKNQKMLITLTTVNKIKLHFSVPNSSYRQPFGKPTSQNKQLWAIFLIWQSKQYCIKPLYITLSKQYFWLLTPLDGEGSTSRLLKHWLNLHWMYFIPDPSLQLSGNSLIGALRNITPITNKKVNLLTVFVCNTLLKWI